MNNPVLTYKFTFIIKKISVELRIKAQLVLYILFSLSFSTQIFANTDLIAIGGSSFNAEIDDEQFYSAEPFAEAGISVGKQEFSSSFSWLSAYEIPGYEYDLPVISVSTAGASYSNGVFGPVLSVSGYCSFGEKEYTVKSLQSGIDLEGNSYFLFISGLYKQTEHSYGDAYSSYTVGALPGGGFYIGNSSFFMMSVDLLQENDEGFDPLYSAEGKILYYYAINETWGFSPQVSLYIDSDDLLMPTPGGSLSFYADNGIYIELTYQGAIYTDDNSVLHYISLYTSYEY